jgi:hypothetical protein
LFSFESFAEYERYRAAAARDDEALEATRFRDERAGVLGWSRSFFRPVLPADSQSASTRRHLRLWISESFRRHSPQFFGPR